MGHKALRIQSKLRCLLQALLISAVMIAPVWGQIHKTIHGIKSTDIEGPSLFSEHSEGSLVCQALDHLATDEGPQLVAYQIQFEQPEVFFTACQFTPRDVALTLAFSARAPPTSL
ncbi:MAG: hypothetical protein EB032_01910 [Betaproteobacteria bacterium]|jgi:hypothetical protein|nr:hypothetical protein [Betaproteobacteria bacterium]NDE23448.1 hypothetical protein [Betaproteobacteria bacterium]